MDNLIGSKLSPKLSIVVIAYNNELYIEEALESLNEQTFQDFEVVVVNDCSTDRTGELIDRFVSDKPKFKAIHLKENSGGCSVPRNVGIANTTGKYIMFLDGDDWYTETACEKMVSAIERTDSDFVGGQVIRTNLYNIWFEKLIYSEERTNINVREFMSLLFDTLSVNKIYKRSFLDKHNLRFPEGIHYEDVVFTGKAYFLAERISIIPEPIYYWRVVENAKNKSITNRRFEFDNFKNRITAHRIYDQFLKENGFEKYQEYKNIKFLRHDLKLYINDYLMFDEEYREKFHHLIYEYMHEVIDVYSFLQLPQRERILYFLLYIGDREAFEDYINYTNGLPTASNRVMTIGNTYYFYSSIAEQYQLKFLEMEEIDIDFKLTDIKLSENQFSFLDDVIILSIDEADIYYYWILENNKTKEVIYSKKSKDGRTIFDITSMTPGKYYLGLVVVHEGNIHRKLVKKDNIEILPNIKVEDKKLIKATHVNFKNTFAIEVTCTKEIYNLSFLLSTTKIKAKKESKITKIFTNLLKNRYKKLSVRPKWILFESHMGKQYSDSPKYIYEELLKTGKNFKYIWSFTDPESVSIPGPAKKVKRHSLKHYYYLNRAKYWVDNQGMAHLTTKKKEQIYLQTWHGTPLKRMGYDQKTLPSKSELNKLKRQTSAWNYFISPNPYSTEIFKRSFRYTGKVLETGYPRNDILINRPSEDLINKIKQHFKISPDKKVILYAPTFRDWNSESYKKTINDINKMSKILDENTVVLLRLHYLLMKTIEHLPLPPNMINASTYEDIQELYLIADILVTDYSSVMFDYALLKRPIILYCYDLNDYLARRGTYFDLEEKAPGPVCSSIEEVVSFINKPESLNEYNGALERFVEEFGKLEDGNAAKRVIKEVFNIE